MYRRSFSRFIFEIRENLNGSILFCVHSHDCELYICLTYDQKIKKNDITGQVVANKLDIEKLPIQFQTIRRLEKVPVSRRILFKKISVMPKGQSPMLKRRISNISISEIDGKLYEAIKACIFRNGLLLLN